MFVVIISGVTINLLLVFLLLAKKNKQIADYSLLGLISVYASAMLLACLEIYNRENQYPFPSILQWSVPPILLVGPAIWLYIKSVTVQQFRFKPVYLLHLVPFFAIFFLFITHAYTLPVEQRIEMDTTQSFRGMVIFPVTIAAIAVSTQTYYIWGLILIRNFRKRIRNFFSDTHSFDLNWLMFLLISAIIFHAAISLLYIINYLFVFISYGLLQSVGYTFASLFIFAVGFYGIRQGTVFSHVPEQVNLDKAGSKPLKTQNLDNKEKQFVDELLTYMTEKKPYLNPELNIAILSNDLNQPVEFVSGILNGCLNRNFFDFINFYRVEEFKKQCVDMKNQKLSITGIAFNCGFNSKTSFYRAFNKYEGITPKEYLERVPQKSGTTFPEK